MSSNILLDPIPELTEALRTNAFGITSSRVIMEQSFPHTPEDKASVREESSKTGRTSARVVARASIVLLEGGDIEVVLDQRGYTVESARDPASGVLTHPKQTYESLETLLIAISPRYVAAMTREVGKRFEGFQGVKERGHTRAEEIEAEGGDEASWRGMRS